MNVSIDGHLALERSPGNTTKSPAIIQEMHQVGITIFKAGNTEFGRRLAAEGELEFPGPERKIPGICMDVIWYEGGSFIIYPVYPALLSIKSQRHAKVNHLSLETDICEVLVVNTITNKVARLLWKDETVRRMNLAISQDDPRRSV